MKLQYPYLLFLAFILSLASCTKEIDLKYKNNYERLVVEAIVVAEQTHHRIQLTREVSYFSQPELVFAENLEVSIVDEHGNKGDFHYIDSGYYELDNYLIQHSTEYTLKIKDKGEIISAKSKSSSPITIDAIEFGMYSFETFQGNSLIEGFIPIFTDPANENNYYSVDALTKYKNPWTNIYTEYIYDDEGYEIVDSIIHQNIYYHYSYKNASLYNDDYFKGTSNNTPSLYGYNEPGDTLFVTVRSLDKSYYQFLKTISESYYSGGLGPSPSNPTSNFEDKALGYFSVEVWAVGSALVP